MKIVLEKENGNKEAEREEPRPNLVTACFTLVPPGETGSIGTLALTLSRPLDREGRSLVELALPYLAWTLENGLNLLALDDERCRLEKEQYAGQRRLADCKRQNCIKKACLSIVTGILPYIDRVANEVHKLRSASYARDAEVRKEKFAYIDELLARINEYNDILAIWIKMRQGALSLNVENFELNELFLIAEKSRRSFEMRRQVLTVLPTEAVVKADKALTMFMINTLSENARKYTQRGGHVELSAKETEDYVEISVADNGPGLSEKDIRSILEEKVYDSGAIGVETAVNLEELKKRKGHGFGLMNCKGVIEKYRKANAVFSVCRLGIESTPGGGSRFFFRLPKGVRKVFSVCWAFVFLWAGASCSGNGKVQDKTEGVGSDSIALSDSLLAMADDYANWVYDCNVNARYQDALLYADSVLHYMNEYYLLRSGKDAPLLQLYDNDYRIAEQDWLEQGFSTDYYILLDVRNEAAIAGLAVRDFRIYFYNNKAYATLYKQLSEDRSLEQYCEQMQRSANDKMIALALFVILVGVCVTGYYLLYLRHRLRYRYNMEQVFTVNRFVFSSLRADQDVPDIPGTLPRQLFEAMNGLVSLSDMVLAVYDEEAKTLKYIPFLPEGDSEEIHAQIRLCFERRQPMWKDEYSWSCLPLMLEAGEDSHCSGVLAMREVRPCREEDKVLVELVASYWAVVLYNAIVRVRRKHNDIELALDDARRSSYEGNMLHVQNMVLDNCLSTIKHETMYYPSRIKQIVDRLNGQEAVSDEEEREQLRSVDELVSYYKDVFSLLASCASRQLEEVTFRREAVDLSALADFALKYFHKAVRKISCPPVLYVEVKPGWTGIGDGVLLRFLLESLINGALRCDKEGRLELSIYPEGDFIRFDFVDYRCRRTQKELDELFYPSLSRMQASGANAPGGTEYLVCKQIVRDHDDFGGRRGCRMNACEVRGEGVKIWFTIPLKQKDN